MAAPSSELSTTALLMVEILRPHTPFAEAIVRRQAERAGLSPGVLALTDLPKVVPMVIAAAHTFVDPHVIAKLKALMP